MNIVFINKSLKIKNIFKNALTENTENKFNYIHNCLHRYIHI